MPSPPAPEKPTWRRNAETDPKAEPEPRRGPRASPTAKRAPRREERPGRRRGAPSGDPGGAGCAAAAGRCSPVSAARPHVRLPGPPRAAPRPSSTSRRLPGRARGGRGAPTPRRVHTPGPRLADGPGERQLGRRGARRDSGGSGRRPAGAETPRGGGEDGDLTSQWQTDRRHVDRTNSNRWFLRLLTYQSVLQRMDFFF